MKMSVNRKDISYFIVIIICCFLTFGVTRAYIFGNSKMIISDYYGTYQDTEKKSNYISITVGDTDSPENVGRFSILNKYAEILEEGECVINPDGIIELHRKDNTKEALCFIKGKIVYLTNDKEPLELLKVIDEPL